MSLMVPAACIVHGEPDHFLKMVGIKILEMLLRSLFFAPIIPIPCPGCLIRFEEIYPVQFILFSDYQQQGLHSQWLGNPLHPVAGVRSHPLDWQFIAELLFLEKTGTMLPGWIVCRSDCLNDFFCPVGQKRQECIKIPFSLLRLFSENLILVCGCKFVVVHGQAFSAHAVFRFDSTGIICEDVWIKKSTSAMFPDVQ